MSQYIYNSPPQLCARAVSKWLLEIRYNFFWERNGLLRTIQYMAMFLNEWPPKSLVINSPALPLWSKGHGFLYLVNTSYINSFFFPYYCSLEGQYLKLRLQYFGHLMRREISLEKPLMLGKTKLWKAVEGGPGVLWSMGSRRVGHDLTTKQQQKNLQIKNEIK